MDTDSFAREQNANSATRESEEALSDLCVSQTLRVRLRTEVSCSAVLLVPGRFRQRPRCGPGRRCWPSSVTPTARTHTVGSVQCLLSHSPW